MLASAAPLQLALPQHRPATLAACDSSEQAGRLQRSHTFAPYPSTLRVDWQQRPTDRFCAGRKAGAIGHHFLHTPTIPCLGSGRFCLSYPLLEVISPDLPGPRRFGTQHIPLRPIFCKRILAATLQTEPGGRLIGLVSAALAITNPASGGSQ